MSLSGRGYPPSRGGTTCRFGSVGPVAGTRTVAGDVACVSPALAPGRETRVFGPEGRIDASEAHRAATTIRILDDTSDEARGDADADSPADSIDADSVDRPTSVPDYPTSVLDHPLAFVNPAVTVRAAHPTSILVHEGAMVTVSGTLRGLGVERPVSCTFGAVVVLGRRASDDDAVECVAPDRAPGEARVGVPGAVGDVSVEYTSPLALALDASALVESEIRSAFDFGPDVRVVSPRDVVAGSSASERATVVGSNLVVGDAPVWCVFGDGVATLARRVSSAMVSCDFVADVAGASRIAAASRTTSPRFEFRRGVDLRTAAEMSASARAPCAPGAAVGCATVMYHPTVPETRDASPSTVGEEGGDAVTVAGSGFPGVDDDGCRFGSVGPVHATRVSASSVTCVTPARAPADAVRVAAYGAWSDDARVAFVAENVAPTFASPAVARRVGGTRVRVFGASRARRDAECRLGGAEGGTFAVAKTIAASIAWWSCDAPTNRAGDAFQTLFVGGGVGTGGGGVAGAKKVSVPSAAPSSIFSSSFVIEYAEDPLVASAWPVSASISGGSIVHVVAARGGSGFTTGADGASRAATCAFGSTATRAAASSSATARCEVPPSTPGVRALSVTREGDGASLGETGFASGSNVAVLARVPNVVALRATPAVADWSSSTTLTIIGRGFAPEAISLACRVGTVGPLATTWISTAEVRCVAPAHSGRALERRARVAVTASISDVLANPPPTVRFDVDATRLDPRGTPGGRRRGEFEEHRDDENWAIREVASATRVSHAHPRVSWGGSPIFVVGDGFPAGSVSEGCRCVFGDDADARATDIIAVSSRLLACRDAPTAARHAGGGIVATTVRVACGVFAAKSASGDSDLASGSPRAIPTFHSDLASGDSNLASGDSNLASSSSSVSSVSRGTILLASPPSPREIRPARVPSRGGATTSLVGHAYPPESNLAGSTLTCRFGTVGPVASRRVANDEIQCVTPALAGARAYSAGIAADADAANVAWTSETVYSDATLLESLDARGEDTGVAAPPGGTAAGGARFELFHVAGRRVGSRPACAVGASSAERTPGSWIVRGASPETATIRSAKCASPSTFAMEGVGFVAVGVAIENVGLADVAAQFQIHPARARSRRVSARELGPGGDARARVEPRGRRRRSRSTRRVRLRGSNGPGARRLVGDHDVRSRRGKGIPPGRGTRLG